MADFTLPAGFSSTPPAAAGPSSGHPLPAGFSTSPPAAHAAAPAPSNPDGPDIGGMVNSAVASIPLLGPAYLGSKAILDTLNNAPPPGPNERRGNLAPVIRNEQTGALRPAWPQMAVDAGNALSLPGDVASGRTPLDTSGAYSGAPLDPSTIGRGLNLAGMAGMAGTMAENGMVSTVPKLTLDGSAVPGLIQRDLANSGIAPGEVNARIAAMGPGGALADIAPILQARTAKLATIDGPAQDTVINAMKDRQAGASDRVPAGLESIAGPEPVPSAIQAGIDARKEAIGQNYEPLFAGKFVRPVDPTPIVANLNGNIAMMRGPAQKALTQVRQMFDLAPELSGIQGGQQITKDPRTLFEIRNAIDGMTSTETNPKVIGALTAVRAKVDDMLAGAVPGLKKLDAFYQEQANQQDAFATGRGALKSEPGATPLHPDDLASAMQKTAMSSSLGPMPFPSSAPGMLRQGMLSKMYEIVGNKSNDRQALKQIITGDESKWNYQKIASAFGPEKAAQLFDLFRNESTMGQTENLALAGSKTALMAGAGKGLEAPGGQSSVLRQLFNTDFGDAAFALGSKVTGGALDAQRFARNQAIADALVNGRGFATAPAAGTARPAAGAMLALARLRAINEAEQKQLPGQ